MRAYVSSAFIAAPATLVASACVAQGFSAESTPSLTLLFILVGLYFLPTVIAFIRLHRNMLGVFLLNLFLGWTLLGWIGALIWSVLAAPSRQKG